MSIKSTSFISRKAAIERIRTIHALAMSKDYRGLSEISWEDLDNSVVNFIDTYSLDIDGVEKWTDEMLSDRMDMPFYRETIFDNYIASDG